MTQHNVVYTAPKVLPHIHIWMQPAFLKNTVRHYYYWFIKPAKKTRGVIGNDDISTCEHAHYVTAGLVLCLYSLTCLVGVFYNM